MRSGCEETGLWAGQQLAGREGTRHRHFTRPCPFMSLPEDSTFSQSPLPETSCFDVGGCYRRERWAKQSGNMLVFFFFFFLHGASEP